MELKLFADLAEIADSKIVTVDAAPGDTVGEALEALFDQHPALRDRLLDADGDLADHINILRNGTNVMTEQDGFDTVLESGDELAIFPPVSGGAPAAGRLPIRLSVRAERPTGPIER